MVVIAIVLGLAGAASRRVGATRASAANDLLPNPRAGPRTWDSRCRLMATLAFVVVTQDGAGARGSEIWTTSRHGRSAALRISIPIRCSGRRTVAGWDSPLAVWSRRPIVVAGGNPVRVMNGGQIGADWNNEGTIWCSARIRAAARTAAFFASPPAVATRCS